MSYLQPLPLRGFLFRGATPLVLENGYSFQKNSEENEKSRFPGAGTVEHPDECVGTVLAETTGVLRNERGVILGSPPELQPFYFNKNNVVGYTDLLMFDIVRFVVLPGNEAERHVSHVRLQRRHAAYGIVADTFPNGYISFEIIGFKYALAISVLDLFFPLHTLHRGDGIVCNIVRVDQDFKIDSMQILSPFVITPQSILEPMLRGKITKSILSVPEQYNMRYFGTVNTQPPDSLSIHYGLLSQRNVHENFNVGEEVLFRIASFFPGDKIAYDMIRYVP